MSQGLDAEGVRRGLREFPGVEHRIEFVREKDGVAWINDSKGTNPDSTIKAVQAMTRPTILLLGVGNYDKKSDFAPLFEAFDGKVKAVIASGLNVPAIKLAAEKTGYSPVYVNDGPMIDMLKQAEGAGPKRGRGAAFPCGGKLGIYDNYEQRGEIFKELVNKL
ncbi:MAG: cyanophycin synthetase [Christensenellales bacterium]